MNRAALTPRFPVRKRNSSLIKLVPCYVRIIVTLAIPMQTHGASLPISALAIGLAAGWAKFVVRAIRRFMLAPAGRTLGKALAALATGGGAEVHSLPGSFLAAALTATSSLPHGIGR